MKGQKTLLRFSPLLFAGLLILAACEKDDAFVGIDQDASLHRARNDHRVFAQVDRFGLPAVNTVFIPSSLKDSFNRGAPADDPAEFADDIANTVVTVLGQAQDLADAIADFVTPDVQPINTTQPSGFPNGRRLQDDVITTELMLIFGDNADLNDDHVDANDVPFLRKFPYLAPPHTTR